LTTIPSDTVSRPSPETPAEARRIFSPDKIKNLVKIKVQQYIESFFHRAGENFGLLQIVSPRSVQYNIEKSFDPNTDPTQRKLQIARYFNDLRAILPCILVVDGGVKATHQSIGLLGSGRMHNGSWVGKYPVTRTIPLTILIGARDVDEADEMSGIVSLLFNECRNLAGGNYLVSDQQRGETWVIMLPNGPVDIDPLSDTPLNNDPTEKIWYTQCQVEVYFEDSFSVGAQSPTITAGQGLTYSITPATGNETSQYIPEGEGGIADPADNPAQPGVGPDTGVTGMSAAYNTATRLVNSGVGGAGFISMNFPTGALPVDRGPIGTLLDQMPPTIDCPPSVRVNDQTVVLFRNMQAHYVTALSDSRLATISPSGILTPKRPGRVDIRVFDYKGRPQNPLIAQKTLTITAF